MLLVRTKLGLSPLHGIGLFAAELIPAGTVVWRYMPPFDAAFYQLPTDPVVLETLEHYSYFDEEMDVWVLPGDNARFTNHSDEPNLKIDAQTMVAARDILSGEEITTDYWSFDGDSSGKLRV